MSTATKITPDELLAMPDSKDYELVDGQLVERNMGTESSWIGGKILYKITEFCATEKKGWAFPADTGYQCFPDAPDKVRKPDVSFIAAGRLPGEELPLGHTSIPPDLVVEVVSPNDLADKVEQKKEEYLAAGIRSVWIVHPRTRTVTIYHADGSVTRLTNGDELSDESVLPGFCCQVREIFPPSGQ